MFRPVSQHSTRCFPSDIGRRHRHSVRSLRVWGIFQNAEKKERELALVLQAERALTRRKKSKSPQFGEMREQQDVHEPGWDGVVGWRCGAFEEELEKRVGPRSEDKYVPGEAGHTLEQRALIGGTAIDKKMDGVHCNICRCET
ncbi:hypothetical protein AXG93_4620s1810 [Marchantia polymorpha subsp. ruderalis]|uniref:Uncharacterized protein n=1 Tax=Marchantia polymorpha subsp. ruderalis TaxID=1480154 RepID=A0A176VZL3_MARPO|nr:hypothetical protein AXG93_4620s1810 [Marchantia polymorpha subsp. ruderalis]